MARGPSRSRLPATVIVLGVVSLLTDTSSDMIFPLLPAFLAARLPGAPLLLGTMEGLADLVSSGLKWWSGRWADRAKRLKPLVLAGYTVATIARPLMAFVTRWWEPLLVRSVDRVGKGIRTTPRDAMIAAWVPEGSRGRAFGFHRAMDNGGAAIGALVASGLVALGISVPNVFLLAAIPGALAVAVLFFAKDPEREVHTVPETGKLEPVPRRIAAYLVPVTLFGLANSTDAFLLLKLTEQKAPASLLPLAWLMLNGVKALFNYPGGWLADRIGTGRVLTVGWVLYALSYVGLAFARSIPVSLAVIAFYGLYHALAEGAERALLADLVPTASRGRAFGVYYALAGVASLLAGILFGALWGARGSAVAFLTAGGLALLSAVLLAVLLPLARPAEVR